MSSASFQSLPQLVDNNFSNWKFRVECLLDEKGVKEFAINESDLTILDDKKINDFKTKDAKAKSIIVQCMTDRHLEYVKDCSTAYDMFKALKNIFERKSTLSKLYIRRKLLTLKCEENDNLQDHFIKFDGLIRDLEGTGTKLEEDDKVSHILLTLPKKYDTVITVLETTSDTLTLDFVKSKLLDVELKLKNANPHKSYSSNDDCSFNVGQNKGSGQQYNRPKPKCFKCGSYTHLLPNCPMKEYSSGHGKYKPNNNSRKGNYFYRGGKPNLYQGIKPNSVFRPNNQNSTSNIVEEKGNTNISFTVLSSEIQCNEEGQVTFVLDSGATNNLVCSSLEQIMFDVHNIVPVVLKVANGQSMIAKKRGKLKVGCNLKTITIDALIVDCLPYNLLSVKKVDEAGYKVVFDKGIATIMKKNVILISSKFVNKLYVLNFELQESLRKNCLLSAKSNKSHVWHLRLGHLNRRGLQLLNLPYSKEDCDSCRKGKATRLPFQKVKQPRSSRIGELIYSDVWGPVQPSTDNDEKYYLSIIDDFSHFTHLYLLKNKSEAESKIIEFVKQMKAKHILVSRIRTDNGTEFRTNVLKSFCSENGIKHEFTAVYTPQQCGVAERLNRTLLNKVRAMFIDTNLPKNLWGEAVCCAVYQLNRSPTRALQGAVPAQIFLGKSDLEKLRIFGSKSWVYKLPKGNKLEPRANVMYLVGYAGCGYRLWDPITNRIYISRDVTFDENNYRYSENTSKPITNISNLEASNENLSEEKDNENLSEEEDNMSKGEEVPRPNTFTPSVAVSNKRSTRLPKRFEEYELYYAYCLMSSEDDPKTYEEAIEDNDWQEAIKKELKSLEYFKTWTVADLPNDHKPISTKWVFKTKDDGTKKARLVAKGYQEDFNAYAYAPVAKMPTVKMTMSHALQNDWQLRHVDVPSAFLNGTLNEEVYIKIPEGVRQPKNKVLKLNKALYGLKESPRCWNECFDKFAQENGLKRSNYDVCLYKGKNVWLTLFVDDCLITGKQYEIEKLVEKLKTNFNVKDLGETSYFLGTKITRTENYLKLSQEHLINKILSRFNMSMCKGKDTPMENNFQADLSEEVIEHVPYRELIGCLNYIAMTTRPDICFATSYLGRFLNKPTLSLWRAAKRVLQYLSKTSSLCLTFEKKPLENCISAYSDADWGSDKINRKSVSGMAVFYHGNLISWSAKKQQVVALSTAEAEYLSSALCATEILYLKGLASDFNGCDVKAVLHIDNQSAIAMIKNYENTKRSKHIDIKANFIKDIVNKGIITIKYVPSNSNLADIFTKTVTKDKFLIFLKGLYVI